LISTVWEQYGIKPKTFFSIFNLVNAAWASRRDLF